VTRSLLSVAVGLVIALTPPAMKQLRTTAVTVFLRQYEDVQRIEFLGGISCSSTLASDRGGA